MPTNHRQERLDVALAIYLQNRSHPFAEKPPSDELMQKSIDEADRFLRLFSRDRVAGVQP